jgi:hypothetical protein
MKHREIVEELEARLGGQAKLGARFKVVASTISHWKDDGIPARHWPMVLEVARRVAFELSLDDIVRHSQFAPRRMKKRPFRPNPKARNIIHHRKPATNRRGTNVETS